MHVEVSSLYYWKTEHDAQTCEDAWGADAQRGLFAIADGTGTTLFSRQWATLPTEHALATPLLSNDPFELEWWLRTVQQRFQQHMPAYEEMTWNALQKLQSEGSYSTLATLRVTHVNDHSAQASVLAIGDSCLLLARGEREPAWSFPLEHPAQFEQAPICLPSLPRIFSRAFHRCQAYELTLSAGDCVILATDAVAKWLLSAGAGRYQDVRTAMQVVAEQRSEHWPAFIDACRASGAMIDDDSTALVLLLHADNASDGVPLATPSGHSKEVIEQRKAQLMLALEAQNRVQIAMLYGDGNDMREAGYELVSEQVQRARLVSDALQEVLAALRYALSTGGDPALVKPIWQKHRTLLQQESCAEQLRRTLARLGIDASPLVAEVAEEEGR